MGKIVQLANIRCWWKWENECFPTLLVRAYTAQPMWGGRENGKIL